MTISQQEIQQAIAELQSIQVNRKQPPRSLDRDRDRAPRPLTPPTSQSNNPAKIQNPKSKIHPTPSRAPSPQSQSPNPPPTPKTIQWWQPPQSQIQAEDLEQRLHLSFQALEQQAQQINQLSMAQEAAILEFKAIADKVEANWKAIDLEEATQAGMDPRQLEDNMPIICAYIDAMVPQIARDPSGTLVLKPKTIDIYKAEREAKTIAKTLRHRSPPSTSTWQHRLQHWLFPSPPAMTNVTSATRTNHAYARRPVTRRLSWMQESLLLLVGGIVGRVILDFLVALVPALWIPALILMVLPGAIAMYQAMKTPESGFIWGYRLVLILMGLLIGGRL